MRHGLRSRLRHFRHRRALWGGAVVVLLLFGTHFLDLPFEGEVALRRFGQEVLRSLLHAWQRISGQEALVRENEQLRERCRYGDYRFQERRGERQLLERLGALLSIATDGRFQHIYARVLRRNVHWWWNTVWIDKGRDDGLREGLGVIDPRGVVGKIRRVFRKNATVELITSPGYRSVVHLTGDLRPILYEGQSAAPWSLAVPQGKLSQLPSDLHNTASLGGVRVVSSDLSGVFPDGIRYGEIAPTADTAKRDHGISVALFPEIQSLREVVVLVPRQEVAGEGDPQNLTSPPLVD